MVIEGCKQGFKIEFEGIRSPIAKPLNILIKHTLVGYILFNFFTKTIFQEPNFFDVGLDESFFQCRNNILTRKSSRIGVKEKGVG